MLSSLGLLLSITCGCSRSYPRISGMEASRVQSAKYTVSGVDPKRYLWTGEGHLIAYETVRPRCPYRVLRYVTFLRSNDGLLLEALRNAVNENAGDALIYFCRVDTTVLEPKPIQDPLCDKRFHSRPRVMSRGSGYVIIFEQPSCTD